MPVTQCPRGQGTAHVVPGCAQRAGRFRNQIRREVDAGPSRLKPPRVHDIARLCDVCTASVEPICLVAGNRDAVRVHERYRPIERNLVRKLAFRLIPRGFRKVAP